MPKRLLPLFRPSAPDARELEVLVPDRAMVVRFRVTYQGDDERVFCNPLSGRPLDPNLQSRWEF
jgi:hypothetical protein